MISIRARAVVSLKQLIEVFKHLSQYEHLDYRLWIRGRQLSLILKTQARNSQDNPIGEEIMEARFKLEPVGTSSSKKGYDRWLVYIDEYQGVLMGAPSNSEEYARPSNSRVKRLLKPYITYVEDYVNYPSKITCIGVD